MTQKNSINSRSPASRLNDPQINRIIKANLGELRYCYERYILYDDSNSGYPEQLLVIMEWDTLEEGKAKGIKFVETRFSIEDDEFHECLKRRVSHWRFPHETEKKFMILNFGRSISPEGIE